MELKEDLSALSTKFDEVIAAASKLKNKNFADIAISAKGRVQQLVDHPDLGLVHNEMGGDSDRRDVYDPKAPLTPDPNAFPPSQVPQPAGTGTAR